jgi:hypothetical protein
MPHGRKRRLDRIGGPYVLPVLGREVVECQQTVIVLSELLYRLRILRALGPDELPERADGSGPGFGHKDLL